MIPEPTAQTRASIVPKLLQSLGVDGVYARTGLYESVVERLMAYISRLADPNAEVFKFPPVMSRAQIEKSGYLKSFPNLLGCVCALQGSEPEIRAAAFSHETGGDWTRSLAAADLVLTPAACYPLYPLVAARGSLPVGGLQFDVCADCFRREPSQSLDRLQTFRMREFVRIGSPAQITEFRTEWMKRGENIAVELQLPATTDVANDPFFGRLGQMMALSQRHQALKFELLIPYHPGARPTACMSFNYHQDHFTSVWDIRGHAGAPAHTGCVAFGIDRLTVALFSVHGLEPHRWPDSVRSALAL